MIFELPTGSEGRSYEAVSEAMEKPRYLRKAARKQSKALNTADFGYHEKSKEVLELLERVGAVVKASDDLLWYVETTPRLAERNTTDGSGDTAAGME